jgi:phospholipid/cholesterol/gamma-HCH transport system substrate-binding protein
MKVNYFKFGVFLVLATVVLVTAVVILGAGMFAPPGQYFETYFDTPVTGLSPGASVELQGVKIGQVEGIGFASEVYEIPPRAAATSREIRLVRVTFSVNRRFTEEVTPAERQARRLGAIHQGLRVQLQSNLITGKSSLLGMYVDPNRFPVPELPWTPEFPFVPSVPSQFAALKESLDRILVKVGELDVQGLFSHADDLLLAANRAVTDANVAALQEQARGLLVDTRSKVNAIDAQKIGKQVEDLMANTNGAVSEVRVTNQRLQELLARPDQNKQMANLAMAVDELNTALRRVDLLVATQAPRLESILENFRQMSSDMKELSEKLKRNPSELLFSSPPRQSELRK